MNEVWNLDRIYRGYEDPAFAADLQQLRDLAQGYNNFAAQLSQLNTLTGLKEGIAWQEKITELAMKLFGYAQLRQSTDTRDPKSGSYIGQIMQILSTTAGSEAAWKTWASAQETLTETVQADPDLKEYTFLFENLRKGSVHLLGEKGE